MESTSLSNSFQFPLLKSPNALIYIVGYIYIYIVGGTDMRFNPKLGNVRVHGTREGSWTAYLQAAHTS